MRGWLALSLLLMIGGCSSTSKTPTSDAEAPGDAWPAPVGKVNLGAPSQPPQEMALLDVGLVIFDPGIPEDPGTHSKLGIFPSIRKAESRYLPYILRDVLVDTQAWGAVRVLPRPDKASEVLVSGEILHSDGMQLVLNIVASDATGRVWLDKTYRDVTGEADYPALAGSEPYLDIYEKIANDLLRVREQLTQQELRRVRDVGLLQYASSLSPDAFSGFLAEDESGRFTVVRLPAEGDPMLERVQRIKNQEYLFIDNADEQYLTLYDRMTPTYNLWRQNGRELAIYKTEYEQRVASRDSDAQRGSFAAMQETYNVYRRSKEHDQDLDELAEGFNNEVAPTVMEVDGKVFRLNGTLDTQYGEWRGILRSIFALETGLPPAAELK